MSRRKADNPGQLSLLPRPFLDEAEVKALADRAIRRSDRSHEQVADFIGATPSVLSAYRAESKSNYRLPVSRLVPFCQITGDLTIIYRLCDALGVRYLKDPSDELYAELGRLQVEQEEASMREAEIKRKLHKATK